MFYQGLSVVSEYLLGLIYHSSNAIMYDCAEEVRKGNSPNRNNLIFNRVALAATVYYSPYADNSDENPNVSLHPSNQLWNLNLIFNLLIIISVEFYFHLVQKLSPQNRTKKWLTGLLKPIDNIATKLLYLSSFIMIGLSAYAGSWIIPLSYLFFTTVRYIQSKNLYSQKARTIIDWLIFWGSGIASIFLGNWLDKLFFGYLMLSRASKIFEYVSVYLIQKIQKAPFMKFSDSQKKELDILADRLLPEKVKAFELKAKSNNLSKIIDNLSNNPRLRVSKSYVIESKDLLPADLENVNSLDLLKIFKDDKLNSHWEGYSAKIVQAIQDDWNLSSEEIDYDNKEGCLKLLFKGLETYVTQIRAGTLPGTMPGTQPKLKRYLDNITDAVNKAMVAQKYDLVIRVLIKLGIEGGTNCSIGKARALEEAHRMLVVEDTSKQYPPSLRVSSVLQQNRELYFQHHIATANFIGIFHKSYWTLMYNHEDSHAYNAKIASGAPRLGLPSLSAQVDAATDSEGSSFFYSLISKCEQNFWRITTPKIIIDEMQAAILGTHQFKAQDILNWYEDFLARYQIGTKEERDDMLSDPNKLPISYNNGITSMSPDFLTLMLLDMGVLHLENNNILEDTSSTQNPKGLTYHYSDFAPKSKHNTSSAHLRRSERIPTLAKLVK